MSPVVVWLTRGGIVETVSSPEADVVVIDFQNLEAGDPAPALSEAHKALLKARAPKVLEDIERYTVKYRCDNCDAGYRTKDELKPLVDMEQRVAPGEVVPFGECPACGAVVHAVEGEEGTAAGSPVASPFTMDSVPVKYWDAYNEEGTVDTHQIDLDDQRKSNGQVFAAIAALEGGLDDILPVTLEINTNPLDGLSHVPCAHIHFDNDALAFSLFKIGDRILVRPETNVLIERFTARIGSVSEQLLWVDTQ